MVLVYLLVMIIFIVGVGWFGDLIGKCCLLLVGIVLFIVGLVLCVLVLMLLVLVVVCVV